MTPAAPLVLAGEFPRSTGADWRAAVDRVLAGKDTGLSPEELGERFERRLVTRTYDGIAVQPLYTAAGAPAGTSINGGPGFWPYVRGTTVLGGVRYGWDVRQPVELDRVAAGTGAEPAVAYLEQGASSLLVRAGIPGATAAVATEVDLLDAALNGVHLDLVTVALDPDLGRAGAESMVALWARRQVDTSAARGVLGLDPIGTAASNGISLEEADARPVTALAVTCANRYPQVRSVVVDALRYHEAGAADAEEVACATATGVAYLRLLTEAGLDVSAAFGQLEFRLAATADQFSTLAKLRAARRLWARVAEVLGVPRAGAQRQHAITSHAMLTRYDPSVNLLRNTVACFAAGVGGADAVTVEPHDLLVDPARPSELGRRMARNTQLLLIEESHLARVIDPGGGSWYVEWLTDAIARQAWAWFGQIEAAGGMAAGLESRLVQDRIAETWARRARNLARRADTVVGVSDFPNPEDRIPPVTAGPAVTGTPMGGLPRRRYAEAFEALRARMDDYERTTGTCLTVLLLRLGSAADYTARATYAKSLFETAGARTVTRDVDRSGSADELRTAVAGSGAPLACLCSSDPGYAEHGADVLRALAASGLTRAYVATRPGELGDALLAAGADELVYAGCDVLDVLGRALDTAGVP